MCNQHRIDRVGDVTIASTLRGDIAWHRGTISISGVGESQHLAEIVEKLERLGIDWHIHSIPLFLSGRGGFTLAIATNDCSGKRASDVHVLRREEAFCDGGLGGGWGIHGVDGSSILP